MAKEINLFEKEVETASRKTYYQAPLPGLFESTETQQNPVLYQQQAERRVRIHVKRIIEALLFASNEPIPFNKLREITDTVEPLKPRIIRELIQELAEEYMVQQRSFRLEEIAQGFILRTCQEYGPYIEMMYRNKRTEKLTSAAAEVLAIIAYKQPVTRPQIEAIRGVDSSGIVQNLLERQLIEPLGKLEVPGRPTLYGITKDFLKHFGLRDLEELTKID